MVWSTIANTCSHLQNASKARLALTSLPNTKMNLALMLALQHAGFVSTVTRAGRRPPAFLSSTDLPHASHPELQDPSHPDTAIVTDENVASRRIWVGLKYWKDMPVISSMSVVSKPKQKITLEYRQLEHIIRGRQRNHVKGLVQPGECLFLTTSLGLMEAREAVERKVGGMVLARVV